jgi:hypothetical protein
MDAERHQSEEKFNSPFHKAASFAIYAIVASFVLQFVYGQIWLRLSPGAARVLGFIPTIAIISAIPAGFIALCGIPRYGHRKLLWKGIVGVLVPIVLFVVTMRISAYFAPILRAGPEQIQTQK